MHVQAIIRAPLAPAAPARAALPAAAPFARRGRRAARAVPAAALPGAEALAALSAGADALVHGIRHELVAEGVMHAPLTSRLSCIERYGSSGDLMGEAPPLAAAAAAAPSDAFDPLDPLPDAGGAGDALANRAACLATPVEPADEGRTGGAARAALARLGGGGGGASEPFHAARPRPAAAGVRPAPVPVEPEDAFTQIELWQRRVALLECAELATEYVRSRGGPVRRRRRLALVRAARGLRDNARGLLAAVVPAKEDGAQEQQRA